MLLCLPLCWKATSHRKVETFCIVFSVICVPFVSASPTVLWLGCLERSRRARLACPACPPPATNCLIKPGLVMSGTAMHDMGCTPEAACQRKRAVDPETLLSCAGIAKLNQLSRSAV